MNLPLSWIWSDSIAYDSTAGSFHLAGKHRSIIVDVKIGPGKAMSKQQLAQTRAECVPQVSGTL
jgi:hypothetical protein